MLWYLSFRSYFYWRVIYISWHRLADCPYILVLYKCDTSTVEYVTAYLKYMEVWHDHIHTTKFTFIKNPNETFINQENVFNHSVVNLNISKKSDGQPSVCGHYP